MSKRDIVKKFERMFPQVEHLAHRPGACWMEIASDCVDAGLMKHGREFSTALYSLENDYCDEYQDDCKACQEGRGLEFMARFIARSQEEVF